MLASSQSQCLRATSGWPRFPAFRNTTGGDSGKAQSEGIYAAEVGQDTGQLEFVQTVPSDNPSFLALSPDQQFLFAINEVADFEGKEVGSVEAWH